MKKFSVKTMVAIGIGAALFFVLGRYVAIPSPVPNTTISVQYGLLAFMAVVYGPVAGALIGLIGHALIDFSAGWGIWWSWVIASGVFGLLMGLAAKVLKMDEAEMGKKGLIKFNLAQVVCHLICWFLVAPVLDVYMMGEPWDKLLAHGQRRHHCHRRLSSVRGLCRHQDQGRKPDERVIPCPLLP